MVTSQDSRTATAGWWRGAFAGLAVMALGAAIGSFIVDHDGAASSPEATCDATVVQVMPARESSMDVVYVSRTCERVPIGQSENHESAPALSPAGDEVAYVRRNSEDTKIMIAPVTGAEERLGLTTKGDIGGLAWSPDGDAIAYWQNDESGITQIWILNVKDGTAAQVTSLDAGSAQPDWSPDGTKLAFTVADANGSRIGLLNLATKTISLVSPHGEAFKYPLWSTDGYTIAAVRTELEGPTSLILLDPQSSRVMKSSPLSGLVVAADWNASGLLLTVAGNEPMRTTVTRFDSQQLQIVEQVEFLGIPGKEG